MNSALLAKQEWRLLSNPTSLATKVYKARYYQDSTFLDAKLKENSSYVWRSIMGVQNLIHRGTKWRIGTGEKVRIWHDRWLPDLHNPYIETSPPPGAEVAMVSYLRLQDQPIWDVDTLNERFNDRDRQLIMQIPLSLRRNDDQWCWVREDKGIYTVKSGYRALSFSPLADSPALTTVNLMKIWSLNLPPKVKNFLWRACASLLPTTDKLFQKLIIAENICPTCMCNQEDTLHALFTCATTKIILRSSPLGECQGQVACLSDW